jgi:hypothetical protein
MRVKRIDRATLATVDSFDLNVVSEKIGNISHNGTFWFLPFIDFNNGNQVSVYYHLLTNDGTGSPTAYVDSSTTATDVKDLWADVDLNNDHLVITTQNTLDSNVNIYTFDVSGMNSGAPTNNDIPAASASALNIFSGAAVTDVAFSVANASNNFNYVAAESAANNLTVKRYDGATLSNVATVADASGSNPELQSFGTLELVSGYNSNRVYAITTKGNNGYASRLTITGDDGSANVTTLLVVGSQVNNTASDMVNVTTRERISVAIKDDMTIGSAGSTAGENTKDALIINFYDGTQLKQSLINAESGASIKGRTPFFDN